MDSEILRRGCAAKRIAQVIAQKITLLPASNYGLAINGRT
jgi:hypothetical protein